MMLRKCGFPAIRLNVIRMQRYFKSSTVGLFKPSSIIMFFNAYIVYFQVIPRRHSLSSEPVLAKDISVLPIIV
jgi:hypothetical protein